MEGLAQQFDFLSNILIPETARWVKIGPQAGGAIRIRGAGAGDPIQQKNVQPDKPARRVMAVRPPYTF